MTRFLSEKSLRPGGDEGFLDVISSYCWPLKDKKKPGAKIVAGLLG
jgi:hypothetical protein